MDRQDQKKKELAFLLKNYYDIQHLRIQSSQQVKAMERDGIDVMKLRLPVQDLLGEIEKSISKELALEVHTSPIWLQWLEGVKGIGPITAAGLQAYVDVAQFENVAKLWAYAGLSVKDGESQRKKRGQKINWNPELRKLCWLIGEAFVKAGKGYREEYDKAKAYYQNTKKYPDLTKLHIHNRAKRKAVKLFLSHYWHVGRELQGLPTRPPYAMEKLGHTTYIPPYEE